MPKKNYVTDNSEYLADWDFDKNSKIALYPDAVTLGSRKRVFWICHVCGGHWDTVMKERRGCPYCSGTRALPGFNDLATTHPEIAKQWSYEKNKDLSPQEVTKGSEKKAYWVCEQNHTWKATISSRVAGRGCPYCANKRVLPGFNDLATMRPNLVKEWNYEKNGELTPYDVVYGSKKSVWWICSLGHEWKATIQNRFTGTGCPICANKGTSIRHDSFVNEHPELLEEWDYEKNAESPNDFSGGSSRQVWWKCKKGHSWKAAIVYRCYGTKCPLCSKERQVSFPEKAVFYYIHKVFPELLANYRSIWSGRYEIDMYLEAYKIGIEYDGVYGHSDQKGIARDMRKNEICADNGVRLIRIREHDCPSTNSTSIDYILNDNNDLEPAIYFAIQIICRLAEIDVENIELPNVDISKDSGDIYSLIDYSEKQSSVLYKAPLIANIWNYDKNGTLTPDKVSYMSSKIVWWKGTCGHEWRSQVSNEVRSGLCPYCSGKKVLSGYNDLETICPKIAKEWDYEKNGKTTPKDVTSGSGKKVWWICSEGHSWYASITSRKKGNGCPICSNRAVLKGYNDVASIPELLADWYYEKNDNDPEDVCFGSRKAVWWKCHKCGNIWKAFVDKRYKGQGCPKCNEQIRKYKLAKSYVERSGSLSEKRPDLLLEWDWSSNVSIDPSEVTCGCTKKVSWICKECGNKWEAEIRARVRIIGGGCSKCANRKRSITRQQTLLKHKRPITETHHELVSEWCYEKNQDLKPELLTSGSGKKVWWHCSNCGNEWEAPICNRTRGRGKCPKCHNKT